METIDYIFILCGIAVVFAILVTIIHSLIPKDLMMESKEINIKRGKKIGSIIGIIIGLFLGYYLWVNGYLDFF
tara:strand:+ start:123 stop:341 length:219 start_codon:yes stop_codon:yes gene_type:complete